jgi:hypothetical protein
MAPYQETTGPLFCTIQFIEAAPVAGEGLMEIGRFWKGILL